MAIPRPRAFPGNEHSFDLNGVFVHRNQRSASYGISVSACDEKDASRDRNQVRVEDSDIRGRRIVTLLDLIDECRKQSRHIWGTGVFFRYRNHLGNSVHSCAIIAPKAKLNFARNHFPMNWKQSEGKTPCERGSVTCAPCSLNALQSVLPDGWTFKTNEDCGDDWTGER